MKELYLIAMMITALTTSPDPTAIESRTKDKNSYEYRGTPGTSSNDSENGVKAMPYHNQLPNLMLLNEELEFFNNYLEDLRNHIMEIGLLISLK